MKRQIPLLLIVLRLILGFVVLMMAMMHAPAFAVWSIILLTIGLLSDVLDGIIARRLQVSTQRLRRLDSTVDQLFFVAVAIATYLHCPAFFHAHLYALALLLSMEALTYVVSYIRFRKEIATHTLGAKFWTLILFATLVQLIAQCDSTWIFYTCITVGVITRLEIVAIILTLKEWTNDVPTWYHAVRIRHGKPIQRNKLFNG